MFTQWSFELFLVSGPAVSTVQAVARDSAALQVSLLQLDAELTRLSASFLAGPRLSRLDCEVLPKLHHLRVAADYLKDFSIPAGLTGIWRYLHAGYNQPIFRQTCPPDQEICLHWADRPDTPRISRAALNQLTRENPRFSFDVPATAVPVNVHY